MPQLDTVTFLSQLFWLVIIFGAFYLIVLTEILPSFSRVLKSRLKKLKSNGISNLKIRWDRVFTTIHEDGEPRSYLIHFIIFCIISWVANKFFISSNKK